MNFYLIHVEQVQVVDAVAGEARVTMHLRYDQQHQGHRVINDSYHENHKDDHGDGEDVDIDKSTHV